MISITGAVHVIVLLLVCGLIFGLLLWLINVVSSKFPSFAPFANVAYVVLAILAVLVLIGILLSLVTDVPIFRP